MRNLGVSIILSLTVMSAQAIQVTYTLTQSQLTVTGLPHESETPGFMTDPGSFTAAQWTDLTNWRWSVSVYNGEASAGGSNLLSGTLAPFTALDWDAAFDVSSPPSAVPPGSDEYAEFFFDFCGSQPPYCGYEDELFGSGYHQIHGTRVHVENSSDQPLAFWLEGSAYIHAHSMIAAIPEPASEASLLAGLVFLAAAFAVRKRRA